MSILPVIFGVSFYSALAFVWVKGVRYLKKHAPQHLPGFHMILTVIRMISILTVIGLYLIFISESQEETEAFVIMMLSNVCSDDDGHIINKTLNRCISYTI